MSDDVVRRSSGRAAEAPGDPGAGRDEAEPGARHGSAVRRFLVWCPDWPVVAAVLADGLGSLAPAAVFNANRVLACSATARDAGVRRGMRRREAQGRCPELAVSEHDPARDARLFEPVVTAVEQLTPGVEVVRPGLVAIPARGPARYFGSEDAAAERLVDQVAARAGVECQVGVADGLFAGVLAARRGVLVPPGGSRDFLAPLSIAEIDQPAQRLTAGRAELVDLLRRLGIRTLGDFAALVPGDVSTRFGADALLAQRAARGEEERPPDRRRPPPELTVTERLDPPVDRVDAAAFAAKALAERLHLLLGERGIACTRLGISARTQNGEQLHRVWRCAEPLTPADTVDRVRWQLDGWLSARSREPRPTSGVAVLELCPEEVVGASGLQLDLMRSATGAADARAGRAFVRVQGLLGPDQVLVGIPSGGRDARDRVTLVPWGAERRPQREPDRPWPGRIPAPSPSVLPESPWPATVLDAAEEPVRITTRLELTAPPRRVLVGGRSRAVTGWAGPWPLRERWWDSAPDAVRPSAPGAGADPAGAAAEPGMVARMQVVLAAEGDTGRTDASTVERLRNRLSDGPAHPPGAAASVRARLAAEPGANDRAPNDRAPNDRAPNDRAPDGGAPSDRAPSGGAPDGGALDGRAPSDGAPSGGAPDGGAPDGGAPDGGAPSGRTPSGRAPDGRAPDGRTPDDRTSDRPDGGESGGAGLRVGATDSAGPSSGSGLPGGPRNASSGDPGEQGEVALLLVHENDEWWVQGVYR